MNTGQLVTLSITTVFLLVIFSYYFLLFYTPKPKKKTPALLSLTVIIPAHNEQRYIAPCIASVIAADFSGTKEIIVIDDGSIDATKQIALKFKERGVQVISQRHSGKSASINVGLSRAQGEAIAIVDADSVIAKDSLMHMADELRGEKVAAVCGVIGVKNRTKYVNLWAHIEQIYNSLMRSIFAKINANVTTPGPLSMYRKSAVQKIGGFSTQGFSEDVDVTIRLIRAGYHIGFSKNARADTNMPYDIRGFLQQRTRFARGMLDIFKRHLRLNSAMIDLYTLPLLVFIYAQAVIMGSFTLYQIISGYHLYFFSKGIIFNIAVARFFFEWFSIIGFINWAIGIFTGATAVTAVNIIGIMATLLSYPLYFIAILTFDKKIDGYHLLAICFMFPFWLLIMMLYIICLPEIFRKKQYNIWKKNE